MRMAVLAGVVAVAGAGCSFIHEGRSFDTKKVPFLRDGITTIAEAENYFGRPVMKFKGEDGSETWAYHKGLETQVGLPIIFIYVGARTQRSESMSLTFADGKLTKHSYGMSIGTGPGPMYSGEPIKPPPPQDTRD